MFAKEFIEVLKTAEPHFDWSCSRINRKIRGRLRSDRKTTVRFDPIRAVCYLKTGKIFTENEWIDAADAIGLSLIAAGDLIAAANNINGAPESGRQAQNLRRLIANALMIEPENAADGPAMNRYRLRLSRI